MLCIDKIRTFDLIVYYVTHDGAKISIKFCNVLKDSKINISSNPAHNWAIQLSTKPWPVHSRRKQWGCSCTVTRPTWNGWNHKKRVGNKSEMFFMLAWKLYLLMPHSHSDKCDTIHHQKRWLLQISLDSFYWQVLRLIPCCLDVDRYDPWCLQHQALLQAHLPPIRSAQQDMLSSDWLFFCHLQGITQWSLP